MSALTLKPAALTFWSFDGTTAGASEAATQVPTRYSEYLRSFAGGSATGNVKLAVPAQAIYAVQRESAKDNWDGEGAVAIPFEAAVLAERLLLVLPPDAPTPDIFADPSGAISFEWCRKPRYRLVLSVYANGVLEFASLLGVDNEDYGSARLGRGLPRSIRNHLRDLFAEEAAA